MLSKLAIGIRKLRGREHCDVFERRGLFWNLDLTEGIDLSIYLFGRFEREVFQGYRKILKPNSVVLDIGANIGAHTLPMARLCGEHGVVHAFEPTLYAVQKLKENLALNPGLKKQVVVHHTLLTNKNDQRKPEAIPSSWQLNNAGLGDRHPQHGGSYKKTENAAVTSVDVFMATYTVPHIDMIKLDVDGNEWSVLQGAVDTIAQFKPTILMEFSLDYDQESFTEILTFLDQMNYSARRLLGGDSLPLNCEALRRFIPVNGSINVKLDAPKPVKCPSTNPSGAPH